jgi:hypothetical protein
MLASYWGAMDPKFWSYWQNCLGLKTFLQPNFMDIIIVACWTMRTMRNGIIFDNKWPSLGHWESCFKEDLALLVLRCKYSKKSLLTDWLSPFFNFCTDLYPPKTNIVGDSLLFSKKRVLCVDDMQIYPNLIWVGLVLSDPSQSWVIQSPYPSDDS